MVLKWLAVSFLVGAALAMQACTQQTSPEESCSFVQNNDLQRVSWGAQLPVVFYIDSGVPASWFDQIKAASAVWNQAIGREVLKVAGWTNTDGVPQQDGANVIYSLQKWESDRTTEQARTTVYWAGDRIYEADIRINEKDFDFSWTDTPESSRVDIYSLLLHEFGHALGLSHSETAQSVMSRSLASATLRRKLSQSDVNSIRCEY